MNKKIVLALIFASLFISCAKTETNKAKEEMMVEKVVEEKPDMITEEADMEIKSETMETTEKVEEEENMEGVLAIVDGEKITEENIEIEMNAMPDKYKSYFETDEGKTQLLERIIQQKLLLREAVAEEMDKNEDFIKNVEAYEERLLASKYITEKIFDQATISDEELKAAYEKNKDAYKQPAQINASHILIKTAGLENGELEAAKIKAIEILNRALEGDDFAELAKNYSEGPSAPNGGSLGWFGKGELVKPFEDAAFNGEKGEVYPEIVETQFGYHIIKVDDKKDETYAPFDEVAEQLREETLNQMRYDSYNKVVEELKTKYEVELIGEEEETEMMDKNAEEEMDKKMEDEIFEDSEAM